MTTKDKTGDQLMASIRKAKTEGAAPEKTPAGGAQPAAEAPKAAPAKARPTAAPKRAATTTRKKVAARPKAAQADDRSADPAYQSPGRVWPD